MAKGSNNAATISGRSTAGKALRAELVGKIAPILAESDSIPNSTARLNIQANCLDMLIALTEIIEEYELD